MNDSNTRNLSTLLGIYLPPSLPLQQGFYLLGTLAALPPLHLLHKNQKREPRQPPRTAWTTSIQGLLAQGFRDPIGELIDEDNINLQQQLSNDMTSDLEHIFDLLGIDLDPPAAPNSQSNNNGGIFPILPTILVTARLNCQICPSDELHTLRRRVQPQKIRILGGDFQWKDGILFIAHCPTCRSDYYPDRYTYMTEDGTRKQRLEYNAAFLRISKSGIWASRSVGFAQENAVNRFHSGWSNFASWLNDVLLSKPDITNRQSQRLFLEHFGRRLLVAHGKSDVFECSANPTSADFATSLRELIGVDGGRIPSSMHHGCIECTHKKRYRSDLLEEGAILDDGRQGLHHIAGLPDVQNGLETITAEDMEELPIALGLPPVQENQADEDEPRGYVRMAVMDGKTIGHRICALSTCTNPLENYKNGRFCEEHRNLKNTCGIIPCGRRVSAPGALTCDSADHKNWHQAYTQRFSRLSYSGVRRVICRQHNLREEGRLGPGGAPQLNVEQQLPRLGETSGNQVAHTFRAQSVYCVQTVQWACGIPVGWGKCYRSESSPQVLRILKRIWEGFDNYRPSFVAYDDACNLLRHVVTQNPQDSWLRSTKFIVDAWHYIGHRATDVLCRVWCNPAPANGSQPDLVITEIDDEGQSHITRGFNTETAEHLNSWLDGFESQLSQMSAVNYDIYMHSLMLIYKESVEDRIRKKENELPDDFWDN